MTLYVRTGSGGANADYLIEDLGFIIITGASWKSLSYEDKFGPGNGAGQFTDVELKDSYDLYQAILSGSLEWSTDGTTQRTDPYDADTALVIDIQNNDFNLTDGYLVLPNRTDPPPGTLRPGEFYYDSNDGYLVFYDGYQAQFIVLSEGQTTDHGNLTGLSDDDHLQYLLLSGNATRNTITGTVNASGGRIRLPSNVDPNANFAAPVAGEIAYDSNDGYVVFYDGVAWRRDGYQSDHGELSGLGDDDHPQYFHLSQNETVLGTTTFNPSTSTDPAFIIIPDGSAPTTNLVDGAITVVSGIMYVYDGTRTKWLSVSRPNLTAAKAGNAKDVYLRVHDSVATSQTGYRALRNGTITGMFAQADTSSTWTFEIRLNGSLVASASLSISSAVGAQSVVTNVNFAQGDEIQFFANTSGATIQAPIAGIEVAWRI